MQWLLWILITMRTCMVLLCLAKEDAMCFVLVLGPGVGVRDDSNGGHNIFSHLTSGVGWLF